MFDIVPIHLFIAERASVADMLEWSVHYVVRFVTVSDIQSEHDYEHGCPFPLLGLRLTQSECLSCLNTLLTARTAYTAVLAHSSLCLTFVQYLAAHIAESKDEHRQEHSKANRHDTTERRVSML